jgi:hypothetical protein
MFFRCLVRELAVRGELFIHARIVARCGVVPNSTAIPTTPTLIMLWRVSRDLIEEAALLRMGNCFKASVSTKLSVDVVKVVAERLGGNAELPSDGCGVTAAGKQLENPALLLREHLYRRMTRRFICK